MNDITCPLCGSSNIIYKRETGEYICANCGWTIQITDLKYYKPYKKEEETLRTKSLDKNITMVNTKEDILKRNVMNIIRRLADHLPIRDVDIKVAQDIFDRIARKKKWRRSYLAIALLIMAKKLNNTTEISYTEYIKVLGNRLSKAELKRTLKDVKKYANIKLYRTVDEREILSKFYMEYGYDDTVVDFIRKLYTFIRKKRIGSGKKPKTIYATLAYIAYKIYGYPITLKHAAKLAGITEVPIRNMVKEIMRKIQIEISI